MKNLIITLLGLLIITSCQKDELPVKPYDRGDVLTSEVNLDPLYKYQVWFDLGTNKVIKTNLKSDWDISFDCNDTSNWIRLNTSLGMEIAKTNSTDFDAVTTSTGLKFSTDHPSGYLDSLGIGKWWDDNKVYVINRGFDENNNELGYKKIKFIGITNNTYSFRYANLDGSNNQSVTITKNPQYNTIAWSFTKNNEILIEPMKDEYDLCFTQYTYFFFNPYTAYLVTGVLSNKYNTEVALDTLTSFSDINSNLIGKYNFSSSSDYIGYNWKEYNFSSSTYTVFPEKIFIIQDSDGFYYKLHFIDFYSSTGEKGHPKFEFKKL